MARPRAFYLRRCSVTDELRPPQMIVKKGTTVFVKKVWRRGRAALVCYLDRTGKAWWAWIHATEFEPPRPRQKQP